MPPARDLEKELEKLRRLPANKACLSCSAVAPFGWRDVCVKFATLVCSDCKAAHQAYSHRIKSLGMSTFEASEVDALAAAGNAAAAATWLGKLTREQINAMAPAKTAKSVVRDVTWRGTRTGRGCACARAWVCEGVGGRVVFRGWGAVASTRGAQLRRARRTRRAARRAAPCAAAPGRVCGARAAPLTHARALVA
jgi:hypothetical protein